MLKNIFLSIALMISFQVCYAQDFISGRILENSLQNKTSPLQGANILWEGTTIGTTSDENGNFELRYIPSKKLIVSFIGYKKLVLDADKIKNTNMEIILVPEANELDKIEITETKSSIQLDYLGVENVQRITEKELMKAACCNLSESFETNPSIDVSFTDAVSGAKQIEMLGLSGIYTQTTMENLPYLRGLFSSQGLTFIPGTWMHSINVSKGTGSVANGYESITGQIDIEMQKPAEIDGKPLYINLYSDYDRRFEGNLNFRPEISDNFSMITMLHGSMRDHQSDINNDGFTDMPNFKTINLMQRWFYYNQSGLESRFGFQFLKDKKIGGTLEHGASSSNHFPYENNNELINLYMKTGYIFENENAQSLGLQLNYIDYKNKSIFGFRNYSGKQQSFYANLLFQSSFLNEHTIRIGLSFQNENFSEDLSSMKFERVESVPGAFLEFTYKPSEDLSVVSGIRGDYHNSYGFFLTPRIHIRYSATDDLIFRAALGKGYRTANIITENSSFLLSSRNLNVINQTNYGYGLEQEEAINFGLNSTYYFVYNYSDATLSVDFYRTYFNSITITDVDTDPQSVSFYSVKNGTYSNSLQLELNFEPLNLLQTRIAYRYLDVKNKISNQFVEKTFTAKHRALVNLAYSTGFNDFIISKLNYDFTLQWFGQKRLPNTSSNPVGFNKSNYSPSFVLANGQITGTLTPLFDVYLGIENIFDFRQSDPIISPDNVNSPFFDASIVWAPISGRMIYSGLRYRI